MTTTDRDAEAWADNRAPARYRETMPHIPAGCDQQGRLKDGQRVQPAEAVSEFVEQADVPWNRKYDGPLAVAVLILSAAIACGVVAVLASVWRGA